MELLLNLAWLLLAVPAYQLWRTSQTAARRRYFNSLQCLLALACALVMLFPVVSATDDLHAMRAEIEESPASKRSVRHSAEKASGWHTRLLTAPATVTTAFLLTPSGEFTQAIPLPPCSRLHKVPITYFSGRAPPLELA